MTKLEIESAIHLAKSVDNKNCQLALAVLELQERLNTACKVAEDVKWGVRGASLMDVDWIELDVKESK